MGRSNLAQYQVAQLAGLQLMGKFATGTWKTGRIVAFNKKRPGGAAD